MANPDYKAKSQNYQTPEEIYEPILKLISKKRFCLDTCCSKSNIPANYHYSETECFSSDLCLEVNKYNGLTGDWLGICWMNPPWNQTDKWLVKAFKEANENDCEVWCCLPGDRMNTGYSKRRISFQKLLRENKNWFGVFLEGKYNFYNPDVSEEINNKNKANGGLNTPVLILYIGKNAAEYEKRWRSEMPIPGIVFS